MSKPLNNYASMKPSELVVLYNDMVEQIHALGRGEAYKPINRFSDAAAGVKRCETLGSALAVAQENPNPNGPLKEGKGNPGIMPKAAAAVEPAEPAKAKEAPLAKGTKKTAATKVKAAPKAKAAPKEKAAKTAAGEKKKYNDGPFWMNRPGSNRELAVKRLLKNEGEQVKMSSIITAVYGSEASQAGTHTGTITMVLKGLQADIDKHKVAYLLKKEKNDAKELTFGLYSKKG